MLRKCLATIGLLVGFSSSGSAAPLDVSFYIELPTSELVTGYLTFNDGVGDTTADSFAFTSNIIGEKGGPFGGFLINEFSWSESKIVDQIFEADVFKVAPGGFYNFNIGGVRDDGLSRAQVRFDCVPSCSESVFGVITYGTVPLPAGLPLLLAGVGAFGFLRRRTKSRLLADT